MSNEKTTICKLCQKVLGIDEAQSHHCANWCSETESTSKLENTNESDT